MGRGPWARGHRVLASIVVISVVTAFGGIASAQDPGVDLPSEVPSDPDELTTPGGGLDQAQDSLGKTADGTPAEGATNTDFTPAPDPNQDYWRQVAGAIFPTSAGDDPTKLTADSATRFDEDLFAVSMGNSTLGFAGGSACEDHLQQADEELDGAFGRRVATCTDDSGTAHPRVPVLYRYANSDTEGESWERVDLPGATRPGYIGAIAWMPDGKAMAVGGTGAYPRREPAYGEDVDGGDCPPPSEDADGNPTDAYGANCDQAGMARVWLYDPERSANAGWDEITDDLPEGMRGLTTVAFDQKPGDPFGFAGALGQIWTWNGEAFDPQVIDMHTDEQLDGTETAPGVPGEKPATVRRVDNGLLFRFRVRQLRFVPGQTTLAYGVTDGCCADSPLRNTPRLLAYDGKTWYLTPLGYGGQETNGSIAGGSTDVGPVHVERPKPRDDRDLAAVRGTNARQDLPDSLYSLIAARVRDSSSDAFDTKVPGGTGVMLTALAGPGGPEAGGEHPSTLSQRICVGSNGYPEHERGYASAQALSRTGSNYDPLVNDALGLTKQQLSTVRLVAADGDSAAGSHLSASGATSGGSLSADPTGSEIGGSPSAVTQSSDNVPCGAFADPNYRGDAVPDWSVGELRSTRRDGLGAQALALGTAVRPSIRPGTINTDPDPNSVATYSPTDQARLAAYLRSQYMLLPSYSLNAIGLDDSGFGWAVGDHGGILKLTRSAGPSAAGSGATQPSLGAKTPEPTPNTDAYEQQAPSPAGDVAAVPALAAQPAAESEKPRLVPAGSPDPRASDEPGSLNEDVQQIVMSRDGSEGWAIGPNVDANTTTNSTLSLFHYAGSGWTRCDPVGVPRLVKPDPACASLAALRTFKLNGTIWHVRLTAAARVPLENDGDPSNDDEFEVVAVGTDFPEVPGNPASNRFVILRYRDGRWDREDAALRETSQTAGHGASSVVFTSPNDGWIVGASSDRYGMVHFDGSRWIDCQNAQDPKVGECGDPEGRTDFITNGNSGGDLTRIVSPTGGDVISGLASAGSRVYMFGTRASTSTDGAPHPLVLYHDASEVCDSSGDPGCWRAAGGGYDPGFPGQDNGEGDEPNGGVNSLAVAQGRDGSYQGWAMGLFGGAVVRSSFDPKGNPETVALRLEDEAWSKVDDSGVLNDYLGGGDFRNEGLFEYGKSGTSPNRMAMVPQPGGGFMTVAGQSYAGRLLVSDPDSVWRLVDANRPFETGGFSHTGGVDGPIQAIAPDGHGGFWMAVKNDNPPESWGNPGHAVYFFHYTDRAPEPLFTEAPSPLGDSGLRLTGLAGAPDGTLWASTNSDILYRYQRTSGWDRVRVPGWDQGRVVTKRSETLAVAARPGGEGLAVGEGGRIVDLGTGSVKLDAASGVACTTQASSCSTPEDLRAAAIAPQDGSALVGGDRLSLLWRGPEGGFQPVNPPPAAASATITGIAMPSPNQAWLSTDTGLVFSGNGSGTDWSWSLENRGPAGELLTKDEFGRAQPLRAIAVDADGDGYAVGDGGLILNRRGGEGTPWTRPASGVLDNLTSVAMPAGSGPGALIGGHNGLILTMRGERAEVARPADYFGSGGLNGFAETTGPVVAMALLPGYRPGQVEAWAAIEGRGRIDPSDVGWYHSDNGLDQLLHYTSDPSDPLLQPGGRAEPLADSPPPRTDELSFAAFGQTGCRPPPTFGYANGVICPSLGGTTADNEVVTQRVIEDVAAASQRPGGPAFSVFSGDALDNAGAPGSDQAEQVQGPGNVAISGPVEMRRWSEFVPGRMADAGVPMFGAIGSHDLSSAQVCPPTGRAPGGPCVASVQHQAQSQVPLSAGENATWRLNLASQPAPWGRGSSTTGEGLSFEAVEDSGIDGGSGARTHYAVDVLREDQRVARLIFTDSSLRSLQSSDPIQTPVEPTGQMAWLKQMLCIKGDSEVPGTGCTREPGQQAIVVTNTPTYSYGPGSLTETNAAEATQLEAVLLQGKANLVVSGRIGWNGLYYATAPGVHEPCPGGSYPAGPPSSAVPDCQQAADAPDPVSTALGAQSQACDGAEGAGVPDPTGCGSGTDGLLGSLLPFVVTSSAGGDLVDPVGRASDGFWHGYAVVRLDPSGDPAKTIVEQRPVLDWLSLSGPDHRVRARKTMALRGLGREAVGISTGAPNNALPIPHSVRFDEIDSPAITHCFDLLWADQDQPWLPLRAEDATDAQLEAGSTAGCPGRQGTASTSAGGNPCAPYVCLDPAVGTIHHQSGQVRAGGGNYPRTFAVAALSVGDKSATYPLIFEPRASFRLKPPSPVPPVIPPAPSSPPSPVNPSAPAANLPPAPVIPALVPPATIPPPAPPTPPTFASQAPTDISIAPTALDVSPPTAVSQPPTPPVNPAPPSGARREARQRQAAAQKSGADSDGAEEASEITEGGGDSAVDRPGSSAMSRHDFTAVADRRQPSAWTRDALLGGGIGVAALILALGLRTARPTPRRREPELPAPAWARNRGRRD